MAFLPSTTNTEFVYLPVPASRLEDVMRFLLADPDQGGRADPQLDRMMRRIYLESEGQFRALLSLLAGRPGTAIGTAEIAGALSLPNGAASLAGMLGAFARRSKSRYDGFWPFERLYNPAEEKSELLMESNVADIVKDLEPPSSDARDPTS